MNLKEKFSEIVTLAKQTEARGAKLWNSMVEFAVGTGVNDAETLKATFKNHEKEQKDAPKGVNLQSIGAYRSAKSVILAATTHGVQVMVGGKVRGKTEVEKELRAMKEPEATIATIQRSIELAVKKLAEVTEKDDAMTAFQLADMLRKKAEEHARRFVEHRKAA